MEKLRVHMEKVNRASIHCVSECYPKLVLNILKMTNVYTDPNAEDGMEPPAAFSIWLTGFCAIGIKT